MSDSDTNSRFGQFMAEMRRRHVVRFAFGYAAAAFVILQLAEIVFPAFGISEGGLRLLVVVTGLGFPPAMVLAWMFDLTADGIERTGAAENPLLARLAVGGLLILTLMVTGTLGLYLARQGVFESEVAEGPPPAPNVELASYDPDAPIRSIAVLPLDDYSESGDQAYFTSSMHEELIAKLSSLEEIRVVSRTSVAQFAGTTRTMPEISRMLDADVIVEGSVARSDERIRVTLQLIHAPSDTHIRTLQWDREHVEDILAFQTEIARELVEAVSSEYDDSVFTRTASNVQPEAQDAYIRGRFEYERGTEDGYRLAAEHFEDALELDPDFAPAMAGIAGARFLMELEHDDEISVDEVEGAHDVAIAALRLDSASMEVREVVTLIERAMPSLLGERPAIPAPQPEAAGAGVGVSASGAGTVRSRVVMLNDGADSIVIDVPNMDSAWIATTTSMGERIAESIRRRTLYHEAASAEALFFEARQRMYQGRHREAIRLYERVIDADPAMGAARDLLARTWMSAGDERDGLEVVREWAASGATDAPTPQDVRDLEGRLDDRGAEGYWSWRLERLERRRAEGAFVPSMEIASAHAALGHNDEALEHLVAAISKGDPGAFSVRSDPVWDEVRTDPRLREVMRASRRVLTAPRARGG